MSLWKCVCTLVLMLVPTAVKSFPSARVCPSSIEISFDSPRGAYGFNESSEPMVCSVVDPLLYTERDFGSWTLVVRNSDLPPVIASQEVRSGAAKITFQVHNIQSSATFSCELVNPEGYSSCAKYAQVSVLVNSPVNCTSDKDCWGYSRNLVCDTAHSRNCMCAPKTARTSESPFCIELVTAEACNQLDCDGSDADCMCIGEEARVLKRAEYILLNSGNHTTGNDIIEVDGNRQQLKYLPWKRDECIRCMRHPNGLQNLQIGLFLVGLVLAFTAVTLLAIVIRKMWLYYGLPPELIEASRDLERDTVEREAEQMAQRDKPPSYAEVMEYDLRVSGYPPPAYEQLATAVRDLSERGRRQPAELTTSHGTESQQSLAQPRSARRFILNPSHRIAQSYMDTSSPIRSLPPREIPGSSEPPAHLNSSRQRY